MTSLLLATFLAVPLALADGATLFASNCATCHGHGGKGDGPASIVLDPKPADFTAADFWTSRTEGGMKKVIREGGAASGKSPVMPAWGASLTAAQVDELVVYMKSLQGT
jgi:mono/diheme cytochrome c family protein